MPSAVRVGVRGGEMTGECVVHEREIAGVGEVDVALHDGPQIEPRSGQNGGGVREDLLDLGRGAARHLAGRRLEAHEAG